MVYQCIGCKEFWCNDNREEEIIFKEFMNEHMFSHGLCPICAKKQLEPLYKKKQLKEGNFDCFGTAQNYCDQLTCKFRELCLLTETPRFLNKKKFLQEVKMYDPLGS